MAIIKKGIFGPISGKIGPLVGAMWRGIPYVKMAPKRSSKKKPRTAAQLANEEKFKFVSKWLEPFHHFVSVGFLNLSDTKTEINLAFSANYRNAVTGVYPDLGIDYSKVVISKGSLPPLPGLSVSLTAPNTVALSWGQTNRVRAKYDDQVMLVLYSPELKIADGFIGGTTRAMKACSFRFNARLAGQVLEVYVGATSLSRKLIADSIYLGQLTPNP